MSDRPETIFSQASRLKKYMITFVVYYGTFSLGISAVFLNPTILDFTHKFDSSVEQISKVFTISFAAYLFGAVTTGVVTRYVSRQILAIVVLTLVTVPLLVIPFAETVTTFFILVAISGFGGGSYDVCQIAWIIDTWRHEAPPFILGQHFAYSVGNLVPPLILGPFLTEEEEEIEGITTTTSSTTSEPYESKLLTPFIMGGCIVGVSVILQIVFYALTCRPKKSVGIVDEKEKEAEKKIGEDLPPKGSMMHQVMIIALTCAVISFYQGMEMCTGQFLPTFSHFAKVGLSEKKSARIALMLQLGFAGARLIGIVLVLKVAPHFLLAGNFVIILASNLILLILAQTNVTWLWVGSISMGVGMSTVFPAVYAYIEKYLFVTDRIAAIIAVFGGLVATVYPLVVGNSVENTPAVLTYVNFLSILVCGIAFSLLFYLTHVRGRK